MDLHFREVDFDVNEELEDRKLDTPLHLAVASGGSSSSDVKTM